MALGQRRMWRRMHRLDPSTVGAWLLLRLARMRILTWNINGIRTIPQYHPWNTMKTHDDILNLLGADVICFQEMKSSRQNLPKAVGIPPSYHSFFSFPSQKSGYSGVAVYTRAEAVVPRKAEEGLAGGLQPKPPLTAAERVSRREAYPDEVLADEAGELDFHDLDSEGRALVIDFGLFVLINVYCPNDGTETEERLQYKMDFHRMLEARVRGLIEVEKREVIVVGDLNACAAVVDHCEGHLMVARGQSEGMSGEDGFWARDARRWLRSWLIPEDGGNNNEGRLVDVVRRFWPERKGMYTCWNTKISARDSNYGTRIDYILVTPGLLPWIKAADIQPELKGSDHCPVFIDLHEQIVDAHGAVVKLRDVMGGGSDAEPPRIAAKFWDKYKQMLLDTFFGKKTDPPAKPATQRPSSGPLSGPPALSASQVSYPTTSDNGTIPISMPSASDDRRPSTSQASASSNASTSSAKRKTNTQESSSPPPKKQKKEKDAKPKKAGQTSLASFFAKPKPQASASSSKTKATTTTETAMSTEADMLDADYQLALSLSQEAEPATPRASGSTGASKNAWTRLLAPLEPPRCTVHGEPAKAFTVNKPGPNKGKSFFVCPRSVGPGYDKGKAERLREEVDPTWKCDFFRWASEVRLEQTRGAGRDGDG
ncbi:Endonuclease/exonuclease/phosphatase [Mycena rosella]|uniref:DNA-(apurinic or apyrimidinic site) endonuclease n=1 Tax=Mycena rosella TaxID=1033263 RepID=A0AAD7FQS1_MYCRO|nr:Endonuclease/exonuclease/phosphatase [Mycena rosella]